MGDPMVQEPPGQPAGLVQAAVQRPGVSGQIQCQDCLLYTSEPSSQPDEDPEDTEPSAYEPTEKTEPTEDPNASDASKDGRGFVRLQLPIWLACGLALLCLALLRRPVTLRLRRREMGREPPNRQLLHRWRLALPLARLLGQNQPEELEALALKARFSQHPILSLIHI